MDVVVFCAVAQTIIIALWWTYWMQEKNLLDKFWKIEIPGLLILLVWIGIPAVIVILVLRWLLPWIFN